MSKLKKEEQIWKLSPNENDLLAGARYAAITLPWTFNRMMLNTKSPGQKNRAINIAKGIVAQEILRRKLTENGITAKVQRKSHRDDDLFDFRIEIDGRELNIDLKSIHFFTDYPGVEREPLTSELIIKNSSYGGPDWRHFFPLLVPHTQIEQKKECYCFAIASSIDPRKDLFTNRDLFALTAFPYGESLAFLSSKKLCLEREEAGKGVFLSLKYIKHPSLFSSEPIQIKILGEWDGKTCEIVNTISPNDKISNIGPFSCVCSFQIEPEFYKKIDGTFEIMVSENSFQKTILNTTRRNINSPPKEPLKISESDFCNLILPSDYKLYMVGWITKKDFVNSCKKYKGWVWPYDKVNKFHNQEWSQITESDLKLLKKVDFEECVVGNPKCIDAGIMKTHGKGGGACCYVFPNIGQNGGVKETNFYVLPQDLTIMTELGKT